MENDRTGHELSAAALREWEGHMECVLRGVAHALNNRAASVSAVVELWHDSAETSASSRAMLVTEVQRLRELVDVVRTVGAVRGSAEAFDPTDAAASARTILGLHADLRERTITIEALGAPPVRTHKWMFVRALVGLAAASANGSRRDGPVAVTVSGDGDWVAIRAAGTEQPRELTPYVRETVSAMGGEPLSDGAGFRLPSLAELRRREGR